MNNSVFSAIIEIELTCTTSFSLDVVDVASLDVVGCGLEEFISPHPTIPVVNAANNTAKGIIFFFIVPPYKYTLRKII